MGRGFQPKATSALGPVGAFFPKRRLRPDVAPRSSGDWIREKGGAIFVRVHAQPGSSKSEVAVVDPWRNALGVRLVARAQAGEANAELVRVVALALHVAPSDVSLEHGGRTRDKTLRVVGVTLQEARQRLGGAR